jgi:hypothetical protein
LCRSGLRRGSLRADVVLADSTARSSAGALPASPYTRSAGFVIADGTYATVKKTALNVGGAGPTKLYTRSALIVGAVEAVETALNVGGAVPANRAARTADITVAEAATAAATAVSVAGAVPAVGYTPAAALPIHALHPIIAAVEAAATVILVSIKVYTPVVAATLALGAGTNLLVFPPDAVLRAALGVPPTCPSQAPAIVGPGCTWEGGQGSS